MKMVKTITVQFTGTFQIEFDDLTPESSMEEFALETFEETLKRINEKFSLVEVKRLDE